MKYVNNAIAGWVALGAALLLWSMLGQALTGGVRLEARPAPEVVAGWQAAVMFFWLISAIWTGVRQWLAVK